MLLVNIFLIKFSKSIQINSNGYLRETKNKNLVMILSQCMMILSLLNYEKIKKLNVF